MTFTSPLGLLALLAVPAIVILHLFRNRLPEKRVAGLFLFPATAVESPGGRKRTRLWNSVPLWLECLAAVLLALWLSGFTTGGLLPRHLVVVLDDSASMGAEGMRERVQGKVAELLADLSVDDEVSVVLSGQAVEVVVGPRARPKSLALWLPQWQPSMPGHSLQFALRLAREVAGHSGEIVVITDEEPLDPGKDLRVIGCGQPIGNAALASVVRLAGVVEDRIMVTVVAYGEVRPGDLVVSHEGGEVARMPLSFSAIGGELQFTVAVPHDARALRVALPDDALAVDNVAWLVMEPERVVAVCDQLGAADRQLLQLPRVLQALSGWREETDARLAQVVLRSVANSASTGLSARDPSASGQIELQIGPTRGVALDHSSPFVIDRSHALLAGVALAGIGWRSGGAALPGHVLVAAGSKALLTEERTERGSRIWCDVDARAGNFVRSPDWPILFANVIEQARREVPGCRSQQLRVGEELVYRSALPTQALRLLSPAGEPLVQTDNGQLAHVVSRPGVYRVQSETGQPLAEVAVRFVDAAESDLRRLRTLDRPADDAVRSSAVARVDPAPMRRLLIALLLVLVLADWWWLQRGGA